MRVVWLSQRDRAVVLAGLVAPLAVVGALVAFRNSLPSTVAALVLVAVIVAVAANGHRLAGLVAAVSAAVWFDFFLTKPYEHFSITHRADIETTVLLVLVGAAVTELAVRGRRQRFVALSDAAYLAAIGATTDLVAAGRDADVVIEQVRQQLTAFLGLRSCVFYDTATSVLPRLGADGRLSVDDGFWDLDQYGMPDVEVEVPAMCNGRAHGRFVITAVAGTLAPLPARQVCVILANQAGSALAHQSRIEQGRIEQSRIDQGRIDQGRRGLADRAHRLRGVPSDR